MTYLKKERFKELRNWDVKMFFQKIDVFNESLPLVLFGDFLSKANIEKIKIQDESEYQILGVRSYGKGTYTNRVVKGKTLKMRTYQKAKNNHLFWCKVDTKNGAFGIIDENTKNGVASSNMTFAEINTDLANVNFVQLFFRSVKVNRYMDNYVTGTTNRRYIKPNQLLEEIKIPLPKLEEQNRIVANYNQKTKLANQQQKEAKQLEQEIESYLFDVLGIKKLEQKETKKGLQFVSFKEIMDWGITNISNSAFNSQMFTTVSLEIKPELSLDIFRGKSPKYDSESSSVILNQKCNRWNYLELEYAKKVNEKWFNSIKDSFFTREKDILINSTGDGTIGRATLIERENENLLYDSHILLLRLDSKIVSPKFYTYLFNSSYGQKQVENIKSAQSTKQTELGITNLKKILFPLPPLEIQNEIVEHISTLKNKIKDLRTQSAHNKALALEEFENELFN